MTALPDDAASETIQISPASANEINSHLGPIAILSALTNDLGDSLFVHTHLGLSQFKAIINPIGRLTSKSPMSREPILIIA